MTIALPSVPPACTAPVLAGVPVIIFFIFSHILGAGGAGAGAGGVASLAAVASWPAKDSFVARASSAALTAAIWSCVAVPKRTLFLALSNSFALATPCANSSAVVTPFPILPAVAAPFSTTPAPLRAPNIGPANRQRPPKKTPACREYAAKSTYASTQAGDFIGAKTAHGRVKHPTKTAVGHGNW